MNKDNAHLYLPLVEALRDGELQRRVGADGELWINCNELRDAWPPTEYRRRPKSRTVPLEMVDLPFPCALRKAQWLPRVWTMVAEVEPEQVRTVSGNISYKELSYTGWLYSSTPNDPTSWKKCEKEVEG